MEVIDFAGQPEFFWTHELLMSHRGIMAITIAIAKGNNAAYIENACYWLNVLRLKQSEGTCYGQTDTRPALSGLYPS